MRGALGALPSMVWIDATDTVPAHWGRSAGAGGLKARVIETPPPDASVGGGIPKLYLYGAAAAVVGLVAFVVLRKKR